MKFTDGYWMNKRKYNITYLKQPYAVSCCNNCINVLYTPYVVSNKGMTLSGPNLEVTYSSAAENIIKVSIVHFKGSADNKPEFELSEDNGFTAQVSENEENVEISAGSLRAVISKGSDRLAEFFYSDRRLTANGPRSTAYISENLSFPSDPDSDLYPFWMCPSDTKGTYIRELLDLDPDEYIYGFGEKFTPFIKNGQTADIWNCDGGTCTDQSYKSVPFYISSAGYGVFVNSSDRVSFEAASDIVSGVSFSLRGERLEYYIIAGKDPKEVLMRYTALTGRPSLPPAYTFGLWLSTSFITEYNEKTVMSFIDGMKQRDIPLQVFHFDCLWMKEYEWTNFEWNRDAFPEPEKMIEKITSRGISVCVWINPYIAQRSALFDEGVAGGYFLRNTDGSIFQCDLWQPGMAIVDFTNPDACIWYSQKLEKLCDMGITNFKTDFGERIPHNVRYFNNMDPVSMHNYYSYLYNKTVFSVLEKRYGKNKACVFSRSATAGCQKYPVHWGGDCTARYSSMAESLRGGLSLCCSGFGFFSHDIGGFEETATPDIYKRWCAFGLLSTHSRLHGNSTYRVPWLFDDESVDVLRFFTKLKGRLMPYLYNQAVKTSVTGIPMMRAMFLEFPDDPVCLTLDKQYMLGDSLLAAPVFNDRSEAKFYLPEGIWTDIITNEKYNGARYINKKCTYMEMPLLVRDSSIIVYGDFKDNFEYDYIKNCVVTLYSTGDGKAETEVADCDGNIIFSITACRKGKELNISFTPTDKDFVFAVNGTDIYEIIKPDGRYSREYVL
ncbi:MAG: alpha-xylosidase [Oscillospiraceae bacterium]|nr:alpha-xylosidase [Oscillospiraceae bacterium]